MKMRKNNSVSGLILVALGLVLLAGQFITFDLPESMGLLVVPALGALFLVWGILTRNGGLMIPGGILSGVGWGAYAIEGPFAIWQGDSEGGVFLIFLGLGFGLVTLTTAVFTDKTHWWALIPGSIIAFVGISILFGGALLTLLTWVGKLWPLALILLGISVLLNANRGKAEDKLVTKK
ncbi:MAG: hypothetical protein H6657_02870 [Ardenticatenaceae bacterium]|nr:hypothetical protein [Anaerolineales bacterium]MCB8976350.1 hypothetical protein [Ardenticatenaceae bacterium]